MRLLRKASVLIALVLGMGLLSHSTAYAQTAGAGLGAVTGDGNIGPGLTVMPTKQTVSFQGTVTGAFAGAGLPASVAADIGSINCIFTGLSWATGDNYALGVGEVTGNCSGTGVLTGIPISVTCTVMTYVRVGPIVVVVALKCTITVGSITILVTVLGSFVFVTTTAPPAPVTSYTLTGAAVAAGVTP